nr:DNA polymerase IV [Propionibacterium sp.]
MRSTASILHLDLDAFFASVEQRDKPSLRGKPVIVGGLGPRGVVSTASYEARRFGVGSAMPMHEARRRCPQAAFLAGRFEAYREASGIVLGLLGRLSPLVEPLSLDEAFVDLAAVDRSLAPQELLALAQRLRADVVEATGGLTASVGLGSSKFIAKVASELAKPDGVRLVEPGTEVATIRPLPARAIPGVGPATMEKLARLGVRTVADVQALSERELVRELGRAAGEGLARLAFARDDRPVVAERETKSISVEDTFERDLTEAAEIAVLIERDAAVVAARLSRAGLFAKTISVKVRHPDFTTFTRSQTLHGATDRPDVIARIARELVFGLDLTAGVRLLGVGVASFTEVAQEELFDLPAAGPVVEERQAAPAASGGRLRERQRFVSGADVVHADLGPGWVWGSGLGRVTVRFETRDTPPGPVRTFAVDDPALTTRCGETESAL